MTNPAGLLKEHGRRPGIRGTMGSSGSITGTMTGMGRTGMEVMAGEGGTTPITAGAEIKEKEERRKGTAIVKEGSVTGTTVMLAPPKKMLMMCKEEEKKECIVTTTRIVLQKRETGR